MISIIIPTYNDSDKLKKTIASCLVQNVDTQIIVVNDCSTQPLPLDFIFLCGCDYVINDTNKGLAESRDAGIERSNYEYILPLDCGDWLYPHVLGKMLEHMTEGVDVVFGNMDERDNAPMSIPDGKNGVTREGMMKCNQLWATSLFRKSLWEKVGGYKNGLHTSYEDYTFWNKCVMAGARFKYIDDLIYRHTYNPNSMLSTLHEHTAYYNELAKKPLYG